jgi:hypothetical protein
MERLQAAEQRLLNIRTIGLVSRYGKPNLPAGRLALAANAWRRLDPFRSYLWRHGTLFCYYHQILNLVQKLGLAAIKKFVLLSNFGNKPEAGYLIMYRLRSP